MASAEGGRGVGYGEGCLSSGLRERSEPRPEMHFGILFRRPQNTPFCTCMLML